MRSNPQFPADLGKFTEEILNGKLHVLCTVKFKSVASSSYLFRKIYSRICTGQKRQVRCMLKHSCSQNLRIILINYLLQSPFATEAIQFRVILTTLWNIYDRLTSAVHKVLNALLLFLFSFELSQIFCVCPNVLKLR